MKKITITGGSLNGNSGAEAMLVTCIGRLKEKYPHAEFGIFTPYYKDDLIVLKNYDGVHLFNSTPKSIILSIIPFSIIGGMFKMLRISPFKKLLPKPVQFLWDSNVLLDVAGVSFIDSRIKFIPFNILSISPAFFFNVPVVKMAQAVGPFAKFINRISAKITLSLCNHTFARGEQTMRHLVNLNIKESKYSLNTDVAFCHSVGDSLCIKNKGTDIILKSINEIKNSNKEIIGICPSSVMATGNNPQKYKDIICRVIEKLSSDGFHVIVFPNASKEHKPTVWRNNDLPLIKYTQDKLKDIENVSFINHNMNADEVTTLISNLDSVIVSRFHAMIFALNTHTPTYVIGWSHKYLEVMLQLGLDKYVQGIDGEISDIIKNRIPEFISNKDNIRNILEERMPLIKSLSMKQFDLIKSL